MAENDTLKLIEQAIELVQKKKTNEVADNNIKTKTANVIAYDKENCIATISLIEDRNNNEYKIYNKSGESLNEGDVVKVYYTTNVAKGWIGSRVGAPNIPTVKSPYVSKKITNEELVSIDSINRGVVSIDFNVDGTDSDVVLNANQLCNINADGTISCNYKVDGESQDFKPSISVLKGNHMISHLYPMALEKGKHNVSIYMNTKDCKANTSPHYFIGVISGQISGVSIVEAPSENLIFKFVVPDATTITLPKIRGSGSSTLMDVDWGDGTDVEEGISTNSESSHEYVSGGTYTVTIKTVEKEFNFSHSNSANMTNFRQYIKALYLPIDSIAANGGSLKESNIEAIKLGNSLTSFSIGLSNCPNITTISFPDSLNTITTKFDGTSLNKLVIPNNVTSLSSDMCLNLKTIKQAEVLGSLISQNMFRQSSIESVVIGDNVAKIDPYAFTNCSYLKSLTINPKTSSLVSIGTLSFQHTTSLEKIDLPDGILSIGSYAFDDSGIAKIIVPKSLSSISDGVFQNCSNLKEAILSEGLLEINGYAFCNSAIKSITIPKTCSDFKGVNHFKDCKALSEIVIKSPSVDTIPEGFAYSVGEYLNSVADVGVSFESASKIKYIKKEAFRKCKIMSFDFDSVIEIGDYAFSGWYTLCDQRYLELPSTLTTIGNYAFSETQMVTLTIPSSVISLGNGFVNKCTELSELNINASITKIPNNCAYGCEKLNTLKIGEGIEEIGSNAFQGCEYLNNISLPSTINHIGTYAFSGAFHEPSDGFPGSFYNYSFPPVFLELPSGCQIDNGAFSSCKALSITAQNSVLGTSVFAKSTIGTADITGVSTVPASTFESCASLVGADISGASSIQSKAFYQCVELAQIIGDTDIQYFGDDCFRGCKNLVRFEFGSGISIGNNSFSGTGLKTFDLGRVKQTTTTTTHAGNYSIGAGAFSGSQINNVSGYEYLWNVVCVEKQIEEDGTVTITESTVAYGIYNAIGITVNSIFASTKMKTAADYAKEHPMPNVSYRDDKTPNADSDGILH